MRGFFAAGQFTEGQFAVRKNVSFGYIRFGSIRFFFLTVRCPTSKNPRAIKYICMFLPCNILERILCFADSIMHYSATAFSTDKENGLVTIERLDDKTGKLGSDHFSQVTN